MADNDKNEERGADALEMARALLVIDRSLAVIRVAALDLAYLHAGGEVSDVSEGELVRSLVTTFAEMCEVVGVDTEMAEAAYPTDANPCGTCEHPCQAAASAVELEREVTR